jgi:methenyltetrahydrofolate cyclohydrolase
MPRIDDQTISAFLDALGSAEPTPGGGTASAVAGAIGVALLMMVAGLPKTRTNSDSERVQLAETRAALTSLRARMLVLAERDAEAYDAVLAAYRMSKATDQEKAARTQAIATALRGATDAPLETLRAVGEAVTHAKSVAQWGNPAASSDVRVALELLEAAGAGASANVEINLTSITDDAYRKATAAAMVEISNHLTERIAAARAALNVPQAR